MSKRKTLRATCVYQAVMTACLLSASMSIYAEGWEGMYVGGQFGKANNRTDWTYDNTNYFNTTGGVVQGSAFDMNSSGKIVGFEAGYNYQISAFLMGIEASLLKTNLNTTTNSALINTDTQTTNIKRVGALKGRLGYVYDSWLLTFNGGYATANVELTVRNNATNVSASSTDWIKGWTTGTAVEYKVTSSFSVGLAYDYAKLSLNNKGLSCANCGAGVLSSPVMDATLKTKSVTTRIDYYFG